MLKSPEFSPFRIGKSLIRFYKLGYSKTDISASYSVLSTGAELNLWESLQSHGDFEVAGSIFLANIKSDLFTFLDSRGVFALTLRGCR